MLVQDFGCSLLEYGLWQLPVFGALVLGNILMFFIADRWPLGRTVLFSYWPMACGMLCALLGLLIPVHAPLFVVTGISLIAFAEGLSMAVLYRFALMSSSHAKGIVSAGLSILAMSFYALGIEITRVAHVAWGITGFTWALVIMSCCFMLVSRGSVRHEMKIRAQIPVVD